MAASAVVDDVGIREQSWFLAVNLQLFNLPQVTSLSQAGIHSCSWKFFVLLRKDPAVTWTKRAICSSTPFRSLVGDHARRWLQILYTDREEYP